MIAELKQRYLGQLQQIGADATMFPFQEFPRHDGSWHAEYSDGIFAFIVTERGCVLETRKTPEIEDMLYWMMEFVTSTMASQFECRHRIPGQDHRYLLFHTQEALMAKVSPRMHARLYDQLEKFLPHPYPVG